MPLHSLRLICCGIHYCGRLATSKLYALCLRAHSSGLSFQRNVLGPPQFIRRRTRLPRAFKPSRTRAAPARSRQPHPCSKVACHSSTRFSTQFNPGMEATKIGALGVLERTGEDGRYRNAGLYLFRVPFPRVLKHHFSSAVTVHLEATHRCLSTYMTAQDVP